MINSPQEDPPSEKTTELEAANQNRSNIRVTKFYSVSRVNGQLAARPSALAPFPMDPKAVTLLGRLEFDDVQVANPLVVPDAKRREQYAEEILSYAQTGLGFGDIDTATTALNWFERRIADAEGPEIRRRHLMMTLKIAGWIGIPSVIAGLLASHLIVKISSGEWSQWLLEVELLRAGLFLAAGNSLGIVFFAFARNLELRFDQLAKFDPANLDPVLRFALVWVITLVLALLLSPKVLVVALGSQILNDFMDTPLMSLLIGILCGYSDGTVSRLLAGVLNNPQTRDSQR
jgi:hypothetical protein